MRKVEVKDLNHNYPYLFKAGNVVQSENVIVLVTESTNSDSDSFSGVRLSKGEQEFAEYSEYWDKSKFQQFTGSITLTYQP